MIIGITGKSGVGKTTLAKQLNKNNDFKVIHIDDLSHEIMEQDHIKSQLISIFGNNIIVNNKIDRKCIGDLIFTNRDLYDKLSKQIWIEIKKQINTIMSTHDNIILDWILLPQSHYWKMCDRKILITADDDIRKQKVMQRDNISLDYLNKRDAASIAYDDFDFDEIIHNQYDFKGDKHYE